MTKILGIALLALPCRLDTAAAATLGLAADPIGNDCSVSDPGAGQPVTVYVVLRWSDGTHGAQFGTALPASAGLVHVSDQSNYMVIREGSDVIVALPECFTGSTPLMAMHFISTGSGAPCTPYLLTDFKDQGEPAIVDCNFALVQTFGGDGVILNGNETCSTTIGPSSLSPPNGATGVPTITELAWEPAWVVCNVNTGEFPVLYFGTSPTPPYKTQDMANPHTIGPLQPGTTYYWRVVSYGKSTPVWSFQTAADVATQQSTWGAIKALYR